MLRKCINILENSLFLIGWKKRIFEYTHSGFRRANFLLDLNNSLYGTPF
tara:strand:+ start:3187 stop:3333 length:147 start_codon:yes stop_codon:yes gene_type:complete